MISLVVLIVAIGTDEHPGCHGQYEQENAGETEVTGLPERQGAVADEAAARPGPLAGGKRDLGRLGKSYGSLSVLEGILVVEQNLDFGLGIADRWAVLKRGHVDDSGDAAERARGRILDPLKI
ncbi:hypothetical protein NKH48_27650 [Mesorhizobium sp. M1233]|uniref:hypothetical protein n=1 Tax=Mesorhizobium sp. M1233 TaxID=2957072 RepID=UPI00333A8AAB